MGELALVLGAFTGRAHELAADLDFEPFRVPEIALDNALKKLLSLTGWSLAPEKHWERAKQH